MLSCPNCPFHAAIGERAADLRSSDLITTAQTSPHLFLEWSLISIYLHRVRIMQSNQNEVHVKIFSRSWDKWGNKSPRGRCAEILTECLIMSWENGPDAININSQRNCSGRHFCSNNTMTAVWQCTLLPRNEHFGSGLVSLRSLGPGTRVGGREVKPQQRLRHNNSSAYCRQWSAANICFRDVALRPAVD